MIESEKMQVATCVCGHKDYAPDLDTELLMLPGFVIEVIRDGLVERGYTCKLAHVGRVSKALAEAHRQESSTAAPA